MKINKTDFAKYLAKKTRGYKDSKSWNKDFDLIKEAISELLVQDRETYINLPFGKFKLNKNISSVKNSVDGTGSVAIKNKWRVTCSCSQQFKELVNDGEK